MDGALDRTGHDGMSPEGWKSHWKRFLRSRDGAAALEFAILSLPYFLIVIAILETFLAFTGEQMVAASCARAGSPTISGGRPT